MNWKQHLVIGLILAFLVLFFLAGITDAVLLIPLLLFAALSALAPDLDHETSKGREWLNKTILPIAVFISYTNRCGSDMSCLFSLDIMQSVMLLALAVVGLYFLFFTFLKPRHRGITHSILFVLLYAVLSYVALGFWFGIAGFIGYGSHLLADKHVKLI